MPPAPGEQPPQRRQLSRVASELRALTWRSLGPHDIGPLAQLVARCARYDGGSPDTATESFAERCYLSPGKQTWAAFDAEGRIVAAAAARPTTPAAAGPASGGGPAPAGPDERRLDAVGQVDPAWRGRGLGGALLDWSFSQAGDATVVRILTEAVTPGAERLYARHGLTRVFAEDVMRRELTDPLRARANPAGSRFEPWTDPAVPDFFAAYHAAFADRPGYPGWTLQQWVDWTVDEDFRADITQLARTSVGEPVGFVTCTSDWIIQLGVAPSWRGRGLGAALLSGTLSAMRADGGERCYLDVSVDNPRAAQLYRRLGFVVTGRRGRYERQVTPRFGTTSGAARRRTE